MKKYLKNLNKILIGAFIFLVLPVLGQAKSLDFGTATKENNTTTIPVSVTIGAGETVTNITFGCSADNTEVSCQINPIDGEFVASGSAVKMFASKNETSSEGTYTLANIVITNDSIQNLNNVKVELTNAKIDNESVSKSITATVGGKSTPKELSSDATLKSLKVSKGTISPEFKNNTFEYTVYGISDTINSIRITPVCNDGSCEFDVRGGKSVSGNTVTLDQGENKIKVEVTAENGKDKNTYTLTVYRGETSYNSAKLKSLSFGEYTLTPAFAADTKDYKLTIPNSIVDLTDYIKYELEDESANATVKGLDNLVVGTNSLTIKVNNASGDETFTYKIEVTRGSEENIKLLKYTSTEITFEDGEGIQTTLSVEDFKAMYPNEYQKIINNEYKFDADGNVITEDIAKDTSVTEEKKPKSKVWLIVLLVILGLVIIGVSGYFIFRKKKPKKDKKKKDGSKKDEENKDEIDAKDESDETGIEEDIIGNGFSTDEDATQDIDDALSDLMNTKQYDFKNLDDLDDEE